MAGIAYGATTLPFTFKGDSLFDHWFNWLWIWLPGYLIGCPSLLISGDLRVLLWSLIPAVVQGVLGSLSNVKGLMADTFVWKLVEGAIGFAVFIPYGLAIYYS